MADAGEIIEPVEDYNLPLHIAALFINLTASALGGTVVDARNKVSARISACIQVGKTFGTGIILATAFIHMLPAAFESLGDESLPLLFHEGEGYGAWAGLIAMLAALFMHLIEFAATQRFHQADPRPSASSMSSSRAYGDSAGSLYNENDTKSKHQPMNFESSSLEDARAGPLVTMQEALGQPFHAHSHGGQIMLQNKKTLAEAEGVSPHHRLRHHDVSQGGPEGARGLNSISNSDSKQEHRAKVIGTYILELGIAMHSVIIGVSLGTTVGSQFISLLIALVFHQFFEGIALGGRIAACGYERSSYKPWLMAFLFAVSTPVGVAIGLGIHQTYEEEASTNIIIRGIFDALSAGILLYTSLVQLLTMEMTVCSEFRRSSLSNRTIQFVALWVGAAVMALIGKWA
ncbi:high-affinity Zn(2+) transporter zrt1 [Actinomortierella ambigua]|nr:high-affinity Zn(2+) transporter zrt1 [Actinomortierella ambigua]